MTLRDAGHEKAVATCEHLYHWLSTTRSDLTVKKATYSTTHRTGKDGLYMRAHSFMVAAVVRVIIKKVGCDGAVIVDCATGEIFPSGVDAPSIIDHAALSGEVSRVSAVLDSIEALRDLESV